MAITRATRLEDIMINELNPDRYRDLSESKKYTVECLRKELTRQR